MFSYRCPGCYVTNRLHKDNCDYSDVHPHDWERAYVDIVSVLIQRKTVRNAGDVDLPMNYEWIRDATEHTWTPLYDACLGLLKRENYVIKDDADRLVILSPSQRKDRQTPSHGDIELIHEFGTCDGALDHGTSAMVSWCEMSEFDWERTREFVIDWLRETGTWERGSFEEPDPETLVDDKKHIHDNGVGWKNFAENTVRQMVDSGHIPDDRLPDRFKLSHGNTD